MAGALITALLVLYTAGGGLVAGLDCWLCIAADCHLDPATNYRATKVTCNPGESCQKVEYSGRDSPSRVDVASVTRSCSAGVCVPHADNCTDTLRTNPGCMTRHCCSSHSLCNAGVRTGGAGAGGVVIVTVMVVMAVNWIVGV